MARSPAMRRLIVDVIRVGRKDHRGVDLISDALPFGGLWHLAVRDAIEYAEHNSRSHDAVITVYDAAGQVAVANRYPYRFYTPTSF